MDDGTFRRMAFMDDILTWCCKIVHLQPKVRSLQRVLLCFGLWADLSKWQLLCWGHGPKKIDVDGVSLEVMQDHQAITFLGLRGVVPESKAIFYLAIEHWLRAARIPCHRALHGYLVVGHCRDTLRFGTAGILGGWALLKFLVVGAAGLPGGWARQGYFAVGHCRNTLQSGTKGIFGGWALQEYLVLVHCRDTLPLSIAVRLCAKSEENIDC